MIMTNILLLQNLTAKNFAARLKQANLASKNDITDFVNKTDFDNKLVGFNKRSKLNKTKHLVVENDLRKLMKFHSSLSSGQKYFNNDRAHFYLTFQRIYKTIKTLFGLSDKISKWKSKGLSNKKIMPPCTTSKSLSPKLVWYNFIKN